MKRWIISALMSSLLFLQAWAQQKMSAKKFELKGNIAGLVSPRIMLRYDAAGKTIVDTADVVNGVFVFKGSLDGPAYSQMMSTDYSFVHSQFLDNSNMTMVRKDSASEVVFSGSATEDESKVFNKSKSALEDQMSLLRDEIGKLRKTDTAGANKKARTELYPLYDSLDAKVEGYARAHPKSIVSLFELANISGDISTKDLNDVFSGLDKSIRESAMGKQIAASIEKRLKTEVGVVALPFTQKNEKGNDVSLASFKGKYVLIDFWASWCGPCRAENPNVVKSYNKYKDRGFAILGVSLDQDSTKWKGAIEKDQLLWAQVSDLKGWQNAVAVQYGIQSIPANFLLGPDGVIIAKNLRADALEKKLSELLDK